MGVGSTLGGLSKGLGSKSLGGSGGLLLEGSLRVLIAGLSKLTEAISEMNDISERLSVVNTNLERELQGNTESLDKNTVGFGLAIKALAELRVAGFEQTNKNLINLATRTKISGQDTQAVIKLGQDILATGSHQEGVMDNLSKTIVDSSLKYGTTTDSMVRAVNQLSDNFQSLSVAGGLGTATEMTAELTALLGQENSKLIGSFMKELTSPKSNLNMQAILGIEKTGDRIWMGLQGLEESIPAILTAGDNARRLQGSAADTSRRAFSATFGAMDTMVMNTRMIADKLLEAQKKPMGIGDQLLKTLTVLKELVLDPFKSIAVGMLPSFKLFIGGLATLMGGILNLVFRVFGPFLAMGMDLIGALAGVIGMIFQAAAKLVEDFSDALSVMGLGRWFGDSDSETNSTLTSMQKILETISGDNRDALGLAAKDSRTNEQNRLSSIKEADKLDIFAQAALRGIDYRARRVNELQSESIASAVRKELMDGLTSAGLVEKLANIATNTAKPKIVVMEPLTNS